MTEIRQDLRYEDRCPNCHCYTRLRVQVKIGTEDVLQWIRICEGCHAEFIVLEEPKY